MQRSNSAQRSLVDRRSWQDQSVIGRIRVDGCCLLHETVTGIVPSEVIKAVKETCPFICRYVGVASQERENGCSHVSRME